jgi:hypothetical protein
MSDEARPSVRVGGNVEGQNVVIGGSQAVQGDLTITVGALPTAAEDVQLLREQIARLEELLAAVPAEHADKVQEVKVAAEDAVAEAAKEQPDKHRVRIRGDLLRKAVEGLSTITPALAAIAEQIATTIAKIG